MVLEYSLCESLGFYLTYEGLKLIIKRKRHFNLCQRFYLTYEGLKPVVSAPAQSISRLFLSYL